MKFDKKKIQQKVQVTNAAERKKIFIVGIILIVAILVGGFFLGQYGNYVENKLIGNVEYILAD